MLSSRRYLRHMMRYLNDYKTVKTGKTFSRLCYDKRNSSTRTIRTSSISDSETQTEIKDENNSEVPDEVRRKLIYSEYLDGRKLRSGYARLKIIEEIERKREHRRNLVEQTESPVFSVALENMMNKNREKKSKIEPELTDPEPKPVHMPYSSTNKYETVEIQAESSEESSAESEAKKRSGLSEKYKSLYEKYLESSAAGSASSAERYEAVTRDEESETNFQLADNLSKVPPDWMTDYEHYDDAGTEDWQLNYGTAQPDSEVSAVPCGGCGALLHCKDSAIPGYLPSELFLGRKSQDLVSITCQRCHFMKHYNTSLAVNVSPEEYPKLLSSIRSKRSAVILLVDLMDFPCSIWPDILSIIGTKRPVFVVGNKVDLLPPDSNHFLTHVTDCLSKAIEDSGIGNANVKHVALVSAKTGFGIEQLINKLHKFWEYKGHVYLVGCTNSGKSTLFNALLQSDYCKSQAVDLIQRATTSPWPGTTLNLLRFPILRPTGWRLSQRSKRLQENQLRTHAEAKLRNERLNETKNLQYAELIGHIGRTFTLEKPVESKDVYAVGAGIGPSQNKFGININDPDYKNSHWCFDTPGTVQPDQVLHLLTTDELMLTLPKRMIVPRTFSLQPKHTLFLGGLGRLDYFDGDCFIRVTVFASEQLPVTICYSDDASFIYDQLLKTEAFAVPFNDPERLLQWPELRNKDFEITGLGWDVSAADIVLSSAGWIAVTPGQLKKVNMRAWTPEGRGIYLRTPALLPNSVGLRGRKVRDTPCYYRGIPVYRRP